MERETSTCILSSRSPGPLGEGAVGVGGSVAIGGSPSELPLA